MFHDAVELSSQSAFEKEPVIATGEQKKQKKLIIILVCSIFGTALVLYFGLSSSGSAPAPAASPETFPNAPVTASPGASPAQNNSASASASASASVENISLDFSIFNDAKFQSLKSFGTNLDISGPKGRSNPFIPY